MSVNFVIGPACAGKSYFIKEVFPNAIIIDIWEFQKDYDFFTIENITKSYEDAENALCSAIKNNPDKQIVFEHTLLRAERRIPYIKMVKKITDDTINCFVIKPNQKEFKKYCKKRKINPNEVKDYFEIFEMPTNKEGFDNIFIIKST